MKKIEGSVHEFMSHLLLGTSVMVAIGGVLFRDQMVQLALDVSRQGSAYLHQIMFYIAAHLF